MGPPRSIPNYENASLGLPTVWFHLYNRHFLDWGSHPSDSLCQVSIRTSEHTYPAQTVGLSYSQQLGQEENVRVAILLTIIVIVCSWASVFKSSCLPWGSPGSLPFFYTMSIRRLLFVLLLIILSFPHNWTTRLLQLRKVFLYCFYFICLLSVMLRIYFLQYLNGSLLSTLRLNQTSFPTLMVSITDGGCYTNRCYCDFTGGLFSSYFLLSYFFVLVSWE